MKIRYATREDLDQITSIEQECFPIAEAASSESFADRLKFYPNHFWLMDKDGKIISFVNGMVTDEEHLRDEMYNKADLHQENGAWQMIFGVDTLPEFQKQGYAGMLLKHVIKEASIQKRKGIVLTCKERLIPYYAKFGFKDQGISTSEHGGVIWHEMRLEL